jgi:hypothetical protein
MRNGVYIVNTVWRNLLKLDDVIACVVVNALVWESPENLSRVKPFKKPGRHISQDL